MTGDPLMRVEAAKMPVPGIDDPAFTRLRAPLSAARVAIVTTAAPQRPDDDPFAAADTGFRALDRADRALAMGH